MKVVHVSDYPLPDVRVERMAYLSNKKGWKVFFAGPSANSFALGENIFHRVYRLPWTRFARLGLQPHYGWVRRKLKKIISGIEPDIIHAHNVFSAKMVLSLGYPFVFDDHELVSMEKKSDIGFGDLGDRIAARYERWLWGRWERELAEGAPIVTVSDGIAEHYADQLADVYVVPNYPSLFELGKAHLAEEKELSFTAAYLGKPGDIGSSHRPYRDVQGLLDIFKELNLRLVVIGDRSLPSEGPVLSKGFIHHSRLYDVISKFHVGLLPWKKHWFHKYANPNKPYIYAHSGVVVIATSSLRNVIKALGGTARAIDDFSDLKAVLLELSQDLRRTTEEGNNTRMFALGNLCLDHFDNELMDAYKKA